MLKPLSLLTTAIALTLNVAAFGDDDDLFSEIPTRSVFSDQSDSSGSTDRTSAVPSRIKTTEQLRDLIKTAGFDAKVASSRAVTAQKKLDPWTFPVLLVMSEDETSVTIALGLTTISDVDKELPAATLLKMMTASQQNAPALFAYHSKRKRTELSSVVQNSNLSGQMLRDRINQLAVMAKNTADVWATADRRAAAAGTPAEPAPSAPTAPEPKTTSLTGKWIASKSDSEAFAVEFKADGTFALVYIKDGRQTRSSGQFTTENGSLVLSGSDGLKLQGTLNIKSDSEFTFTPANSAALTFRKA